MGQVDRTSGTEGFAGASEGGADLVVRLQQEEHDPEVGAGMPVFQEG